MSLPIRRPRANPLRARVFGLMLAGFVCTVASSAYSATNECRQTTLRQCDSSESCRDVDVTLCDPATVVIRENGDSTTPWNNIALRRAPPVSYRDDPAGGRHFVFKSTSGPPEVCSLPGGKGALLVPKLPAAPFAKDAELVNIPTAWIESRSIADPAMAALVESVIQSLNNEFKTAGIALRMVSGAATPALAAVHHIPRGLFSPSETQFFIGRDRGASRFANNDPRSVILIAGSSDPAKSIARKLLVALGLRETEDSPFDTVPGRLNSYRPGPSLSRCELGLLRKLYGSVDAISSP